ncbi:MAG: hypothetical protein EZS28_002247 [Streblomastix strix]|uniref:Uncharacterized protein n=1 Tax=Streblomastix strix TaxID=222440 RepID=A0A5J4X5X2_9EUKA|nr:MAG: hypothetical protein EZS28_002247 [Streblomastix strix]
MALSLNSKNIILTKITYEDAMYFLPQFDEIKYSVKEVYIYQKLRELNISYKSNYTQRIKERIIQSNPIKENPTRLASASIEKQLEKPKDYARRIAEKFEKECIDKIIKYSVSTIIMRFTLPEVNVIQQTLGTAIQDICENSANGDFAFSADSGTKTAIVQLNPNSQPLTDYQDFIISVAESEWNGIITTSGVVETVSGLMLETTNPKIRTLCGAVIEVIQQRGCESGESTDWGLLLSPIVSLLFNPDEKISEIGKQSLMKVADRNPEALCGLIEIGLFDKTSELLNLTFPSSQSSQLSEKLSQKVILNILQVVESIIRENAQAEMKAKQLMKTAERIKQLNPPRQIKSVISSIISILDDEQEQNENNIDNDNIERSIQNKIQELERKVIESEERIRIFELNRRDSELKLRENEEKLRLVEQEKENEKARADQLEQEKQQLVIHLSQRRFRREFSITSPNIQQQTQQTPIVPQQAAPAPVLIGAPQLIVQDKIDFTPLISYPDDVIINQNLFTHTNENDYNCTILFNPVITSGITKFEIFTVQDIFNLGIAEESATYERKEIPFPKMEQFIILNITIWGATVCFIITRLNLESDPTTLTFFLNNKEQKIYITHIPHAVRFWVCISNKGSAFKLLNFEKIAEPKAKHGYSSWKCKWEND